MNPDKEAELWAKVEKALEDITAQASRMSELEIDEARSNRDTARENQRKVAADATAAERDTHCWLWRAFC
jgi:hypothetical protein